MPNDRLRSAMRARHVTISAVAAHLQVDEKTVERWLQGRVPHARHRWALADLLAEDEDVLWPGARGRDGAGNSSDLVRIYPYRSHVPAEVWWTLVGSAQHDIGVLAYAALFLPERIGMIDRLAERARAGCRVRILLGDPACPKLSERGTEEQYGEGIVSRVRVALRHYQPLSETAGVTVRVHCTTLYNSIFRFDDTILVNTHVWGRNAYASPLLHLQRFEPNSLFDTYASSFEAVWDAAQPADFASLDPRAQ